MLGTIIRLALMTISSILLLACGGSDDNKSSTKYDKSYVQFYNGSAEKGVVTLSIDENSKKGTAAYGDATNVFTLEKKEAKLSFSQKNSDDSDEAIEDMTVQLKTGHKLLVVLSENNGASGFDSYTIKRSELKKRFRLFATSVLANEQDYDLHLVENGKPFAQAHRLSTITHGTLTELESWQAEDKTSFSQGEYQIYLTLPGQNTPVFVSNAISFKYATEYSIIIRASAGAIKGNLEVDLVINSSAVSKYPARDQAAQFRIYNSLSDKAIQVGINGGQDNKREITVNADELSDFTAIAHGDYQLSGKATADDSLAFNNRLLSLTQGRSQAIVVYRNAEQELNALTFEESKQPQRVEHDIQLVNLTSADKAIDLYFVRQSETIKNAKYRALNLEFEHSAALGIKSDQYEIVVIHKDDDDKQLLLARSEMLEINQNVNYIVTVETSAASPSGYRIRLLH